MRVISAWRFKGPKENREWEPAIWLDGSLFWILAYRFFRWLWGVAMDWENWAERHCRTTYIPGEGGAANTLTMRPWEKQGG